MMSQAHDYFAGAQAPAIVCEAAPVLGACDLTVSGLRKSFTKTQEVLKGVSFAIRHGETVALIGSNGAGNPPHCDAHCTWSSRMKGGLTCSEQISALPGTRSCARRGQMSVSFSRNTTSCRGSARSPMCFTAISVAPAGRRAGSQLFASRDLRQRAMDCLERVGLAEHALKRADQLSGGQSQRVAIARALMQQPKMIVADEPVASLDPVAGREVMDLFHRLTREEGITLLFTSHNVAQALDYSDRILAIKRGEIVLDAPSASLQGADLNEHYG